MSVGCRRNAVVIGSLLLLCSLGFGDWTQLTLGVQAELNAVHFPTGTQVGYAVGVGPDSMGGFGGIVVKTTDAGATWTRQSTGLIGVLNSVYFTTDDNGYAVGEMGTAIRTTDGGATWTTMTVPGSDMLNYVRFPENSLNGFIGLRPQAGGGRVLKTTDGGSNWASVTVGFPLNTSISCGMATDLIGVAVGVGGMIYGTTDGFGTNSSQGALTIADLSAVAFSRTDPTKGYLIGNDSTGGLIRYTDDDGATLWDSVRHYPIATYYGVDMATPEVAYVCGANGRIDRSVEAHDFFRTTTPVTIPIRGVCFPNGADTGYAVGGASTVLKTTDGGIPWTPGVAEGKVPAITRAGIRVMSNPCRHGIALHSDADVRVSVFDAAGRVVMSQAATKGLNFLPLPTGAYFVKSGAETARAVVTD
jgi:photosystem II stability/assembly factor-like uncharacterized protein